MIAYNPAMLVDFYELTMAQGYFDAGKQDQIAHFDLFFRRVPDDGGYAIFAGRERIVDVVKSFHFNDDDITYLRSRGLFTEEFLAYLRNLRFTGDIRAMNEGTVMFPNEPILTVRAPIIEAQLLETVLLQAMNHQSLIATKASRIKRAADGRLVLEFGARRAHGASASIDGARAAYIGGVDATSNTVADQWYGVKALGTMAHSWIQLFDTEYEAFAAYARSYPDASTFLVDTYDTLNSGVPNAIRVIQEELIPKGATNYAIRIDSGDLSYLAKEARKQLDAAGLTECRIVASNALDEHLIRSLVQNGAPIDIFGVGERLITAKSDPVFGAVYKLVAVEEEGTIVPKIKLSDNVAKITTPAVKNLYRIYGESHHAEADFITLYDETIDATKPLEIFDPHDTWKTKTFTNYRIEALLHPVFEQGVFVGKRPALDDIRSHAATQLDELWDEVRRFDHPHRYYVDLSKKLWTLKDRLIHDHRK